MALKQKPNFRIKFQQLNFLVHAHQSWLLTFWDIRLCKHIYSLILSMPDCECNKAIQIIDNVTPTCKKLPWQSATDFVWVTVLQNGVSYVLSRVISEKDVHSDAAVMGLHDTTEQAGWEAYRVCFSAANKSPAKRGAHTMSKGGPHSKTGECTSVGPDYKSGLLQNSYITLSLVSQTTWTPHIPVPYLHTQKVWICRDTKHSILKIQE